MAEAVLEIRDVRKRGFFMLENDVMTPGGSAYAKLVYAAVIRHADSVGICWPSLQTLAVETSLGRTSVKAALKELKIRGSIALDVATGPGGVHKIRALGWASDNRTGELFTDIPRRHTTGGQAPRDGGAAATRPGGQSPGDHRRKTQVKEDPGKEDGLSPTPIEQVLAVYEETYAGRFNGDKPRIARGKDPVVVKRFIDKYGVPFTCQLVRRYVGCDDPFARREGYTLGVMALLENKLVQAERGGDPGDPGRVAGAAGWAGVPAGRGQL
jgi:hypothetical protein